MRQKYFHLIDLCKSDTEDASAYRPISLLPLLLTILERVDAKYWILPYLTGIDAYIYLLCCSFSKTWDFWVKLRGFCVSSLILQRLLSAYRTYCTIRNAPYERDGWILNFLWDWQQRVIIDWSVSSWCSIPSGCPPVQCHPPFSQSVTSFQPVFQNSCRRQSWTSFVTTAMITYRTYQAKVMRHGFPETLLSVRAEHCNQIEHPRPSRDLLDESRTCTPSSVDANILAVLFKSLLFEWPNMSKCETCHLYILRNVLWYRNKDERS